MAKKPKKPRVSLAGLVNNQPPPTLLGDRLAPELLEALKQIPPRPPGPPQPPRLRRSQQPDYYVRTDASCLGNIKAYGFSISNREDVVVTTGSRVVEGKYDSNAVELIAVIETIASLPQTARVQVYTDSEHVARAFEYQVPLLLRGSMPKRLTHRYFPLWQELAKLCQQRPGRIRVELVSRRLLKEPHRLASETSHQQMNAAKNPPRKRQKT